MNNKHSIAPLFYFILAIGLWLMITKDIDSTNPCSAFSSAGTCSSGAD